MSVEERPLLKFTVAIYFDHHDEQGKKQRCKSCCWVEAENMGDAWKEAEKCLPNGASLGAMIPGHHMKGYML